MKNQEAEARLAELHVQPGTALYVRHTPPGKGVPTVEVVTYASHETEGSDLRLTVMAKRKAGEELADTGITILARNLKTLDPVLNYLPAQPEVGGRVLIKQNTPEGVEPGVLATVERYLGSTTWVTIDGHEDLGNVPFNWEFDFAPAPPAELVSAV